MSEDFNTNEWRRDNIFENDFVPFLSPKVTKSILEIIARHSDGINNSWGLPDENFDDLAKDLYEYITNNFTPIQK